MPGRAVAAAKAVALLALAFLCVAAGLTLLEVRRDADRLTTRADRVLIVAGATATEAHKAAEYQRRFWEVQSPQLAQKAGALLDRAALAVASADLALATVDATVAGLAETNAALRSDVDAVTASITATADAAASAIARTGDATSTSIARTADAGVRAFDAVGAVASDPDEIGRASCRERV